MITRRILIPLDRSDYSRKILPIVERFIPISGTELILFHVADPPAGIGIDKPNYALDFMLASRIVTREKRPPLPPIYASQMKEALQNKITDELRPVARHLEQIGYIVSIMVCFGQPADEILKAITKQQIDLVALTTHAREGLRRLVFGSVAEKVLHQIDIPILLIHPTPPIPDDLLLG